MTDQSEQKPISMSELEDALPNVPTTSTSVSSQTFQPVVQHYVYQQNPSVYPAPQYTQSYQSGQFPASYPSTSSENVQYYSYPSTGQQSVDASQYGTQMGYRQHPVTSPVPMQYGSPISRGTMSQGQGPSVFNTPQYRYQPQQTQQQFPQQLGRAMSMPPHPTSPLALPMNPSYMPTASPYLGTNPTLETSTSPGLFSDESSGFSDPDFGPPRGPPRKPKQSGFALWVGNLPRDVVLEELKEFFALDGLESIFLIRKSNCAFVNYKTEEACSRALSTFNDKTFKNVRLVCRLRKSSPTRTPSVGATTEASSSTTVMEPTTLEQFSLNVALPAEKLDKNSSTDDTPGPPTPNNSPNRYFIMKSLTKEDVAWSVTNKAWATQPHNESVLNEAFRSSENVYLIFSVNKSGEFHGYARMASEIYPQKVDVVDGTGPEAPPQPPQVVLAGPKTTITPRTDKAPRGKIFEDEVRGTVFWEIADSSDDDEVDEPEGDQVKSGERWGNPFRIEWDAPVPFQRTRLLRNPWNGNKEIKISRDGTELEPSVGARLLREFDLDPSTIAQGTPGPIQGVRRTSYPTGPYRQPAPSPQVMYPQQTAPMTAQGLTYYPYSVPQPQTVMYNYAPQRNTQGQQPPQQPPQQQAYGVPPQGSQQYQPYGQLPPRQ